jgi:formate--tetrahydrofolate ligase
MAKNPYSFTDDPTQLGRPSGFTIKVSDVKLCAGAGFIVAYTGDVMTMPGLPKVPSAEKFQ